MAQSFQIFPPLGVARLGNSTNPDYQKGWYFAPEVPGRFERPEGGFKDEDGAIKRQAVRYRVYAFDAHGTALEEANHTNGYEVKWRFHLANKKAASYKFMGRLQPGAFQPGYTQLRNPTIQPELTPDKRKKLIIDTGIQSVEGVNQPTLELSGKYTGSGKEPIDVYLGEARTDQEGRLILLGGRGEAKFVPDPDSAFPPIHTEFDNDNWVDDSSDGWVIAEVRKNNGPWTPVTTKAHFMAGPPDFTPGIISPTTLYDVVEEMYEQQKRKKAGYDVGRVEYYEHIWSLLQRPSMLAWTNVVVNGGHGPGAFGNFFSPLWQSVLSDPSEEKKHLRLGVLGKIRLPETADKKYEVARQGQAYTYFMPWLSGDEDDVTPGKIGTFASLTELQYDRLKKWAEGDFVVGKPPGPPAKSISAINIKDQPAALAKAILEHSIGAPLFPGIETSWNMVLDESYNFSKTFAHFSLNEKVDAGDLTKWLALPWQSDFYLCNTHWWPSARPDSVVTTNEWDKVTASNPGSTHTEIAGKLEKRAAWTRGIRQNYIDTYPDQPFFANMDLSRNWHKLGFLTQEPFDGYIDRHKQPIFVERERQEIASKPLLHKRLEIDHGNEIRFPLRTVKANVPDIHTVQSLREHLQTAMLVELQTIPVYLYSMYSVKTPAEFVNDPQYYDSLADAVRGVVAEEMLHLSLVGNFLLAVGGKPQLYKPGYVPKYPSNMLGRVPALQLNLTKLDTAALLTFTKIEEPQKVDALPEAKQYQTLGQFYKAIIEGVTYLDKKDPNLWKPETAPYQFSPGMGYQARVPDAGGSVVITNLATASDAIQIIVDQGEGAGGEDGFDDPAKLEKSHFKVFSDLLSDPGIRPDDRLYNVVQNPTRTDYADKYHNANLSRVAAVCDAAYSFLLVTIEKLWDIPTDDKRHKLVIGNMYGLMMGVIAPLAKFMVTQPITPGSDITGGVTFGFWEFKPKRSYLEQLLETIQVAIEGYLDDDRKETEDELPVNNFGFQVNSLLAVQATLYRLVDLDTFEPIARK